MKIPAFRFAFVSTALLAACYSVSAQEGNQAGGNPSPAPPPPGPTLVISSPSFSDGARIPAQYTCTATTPPPGGPRNISTGVSPALRWMNPPKGTVAFVLILHDPDAHVPKATTDITHWIVFNIPGDTMQLQEAVSPDAPLASGALQGTNITGKAAYQGTCAGPPNPHRYTF